jgi:hypothetical protein
MENSKILGCANMKKEHDYLWYQVMYAHQHYGHHPDTRDMRNRRWCDKRVAAKWIIARRGRMFGPPKNADAVEAAENKTAQMLQDNLVGRLQIAGVGTYTRHYHKEEWEQLEQYTVTVGDGENRRTEVRYRWVHRERTTDRPRTDLHDFHYKMQSCARGASPRCEREREGGAGRESEGGAGRESEGGSARALACRREAHGAALARVGRRRAHRPRRLRHPLRQAGVRLVVHLR